MLREGIRRLGLTFFGGQFKVYSIKVDHLQSTKSIILSPSSNIASNASHFFCGQPFWAFFHFQIFRVRFEETCQEAPLVENVSGIYWDEIQLTIIFLSQPMRKNEAEAELQS